ncbi:hypothetical protein DIPPA_10405 [Diplonema papillatum]|nr:hypothetical protein DIPPA_10405 [Diplonema papillatum]
MQNTSLPVVGGGVPEKGAPRDVKKAFAALLRDNNQHAPPPGVFQPHAAAARSRAMAAFAAALADGAIRSVNPRPACGPAAAAPRLGLGAAHVFRLGGSAAGVRRGAERTKLPPPHQGPKPGADGTSAALSTYPFQARSCRPPAHHAAEPPPRRSALLRSDRHGFAAAATSPEKLPAHPVRSPVRSNADAAGGRSERVPRSAADPSPRRPGGGPPVCLPAAGNAPPSARGSVAAQKTSSRSADARRARPDTPPQQEKPGGPPWCLTAAESRPAGVENPPSAQGSVAAQKGSSRSDARQARPDTPPRRQQQEKPGGPLLSLPAAGLYPEGAEPMASAQGKLVAQQSSSRIASHAKSGTSPHRRHQEKPGGVPFDLPATGLHPEGAKTAANAQRKGRPAGSRCRGLASSPPRPKPGNPSNDPPPPRSVSDGSDWTTGWEVLGSSSDPGGGGAGTALAHGSTDGSVGVAEHGGPKRRPVTRDGQGRCAARSKSNCPLPPVRAAAAGRPPARRHSGQAEPVLLDPRPYTAPSAHSTQAAVSEAPHGRADVYQQDSSLRGLLMLDSPGESRAAETSTSLPASARSTADVYQQDSTSRGVLLPGGPGENTAQATAETDSAGRPLVPARGPAASNPAARSHPASGVDVVCGSTVRMPASCHAVVPFRSALPPRGDARRVSPQVARLATAPAAERSSPRLLQTGSPASLGATGGAAAPQRPIRYWGQTIDGRAQRLMRLVMPVHPDASFAEAAAAPPPGPVTARDHDAALRELTAELTALFRRKLRTSFAGPPPCRRGYVLAAPGAPPPAIADRAGLPLTEESLFTHNAGSPQCPRGSLTELYLSNQSYHPPPPAPRPSFLPPSGRQHARATDLAPESVATPIGRPGSAAHPASFGGGKESAAARGAPLGVSGEQGRAFGAASDRSCATLFDGSDRGAARAKAEAAAREWAESFSDTRPSTARSQAAVSDQRAPWASFLDPPWNSPLDAVDSGDPPSAQPAPAPVLTTARSRRDRSFYHKSAHTLLREASVARAHSEPADPPEVAVAPPVNTWLSSDEPTLPSMPPASSRRPSRRTEEPTPGPAKPALSPLQGDRLFNVVVSALTDTKPAPKPRVGKPAPKPAPREPPPAPAPPPPAKPPPAQPAGPQGVPKASKRVKKVRKERKACMSNEGYIYNPTNSERNVGRRREIATKRVCLEAVQNQVAALANGAQHPRHAAQLLPAALHRRRGAAGPLREAAPEPAPPAADLSHFDASSASRASSTSTLGPAMQKLDSHADDAEAPADDRAEAISSLAAKREPAWAKQT